MDATTTVYLPAGHELVVHAPKLVAPSDSVTAPPPQGVHVLAFSAADASLYEPRGHDVHAVAAASRSVPVVFSSAVTTKQSMSKGMPISS